MYHKLFAIFWAFLLFFQSILLSLPAYAKSTSENSPVVNLEEAAKKSNVVYLGEMIEAKTGKKIKGYMIVHRTKEQVAQLITEGSATNAVNPLCYWFTSEGMRWRNFEGFLFNPTNSRGLDTNYITTNHGTNIAKWEDASTGAIDANSQNIVGDITVTNSPLSVDLISPDNKNEVYFGQPSIAGAIAATTVWGYFDGPIETRELIEADMIFNDINFDWSTTGEVGKMDFENISTHEIGHVLGLSDIYNSACSSVSMFAYSEVGETAKRSLESQDVTGVSILYEQPPIDTDGDGIFDISDNCSIVPNTNQSNNDNDNLGDACDMDDDNDGVLDVSDNCVFISNVSQTDTDNDGIGDACDNDFDNDGVLNLTDNCLNTYNPTQANFNSEILDLGSLVAFDDGTNPIADNIGDLCDEDIDHDGLLNAVELNALTNPNLPDSDGDRVLDGVEILCLSDPLDSNSTPKKPNGVTLVDSDNDQIPNSCEQIVGTNPNLVDTDGDKLNDGNEVLYKGTNPLAIDTDNDGCRDDIEVATINADRVVNSIDLSQAAQKFGFNWPGASYIPSFDFTGDGVMNSIDLSQIAQKFGSCHL